MNSWLVLLTRSCLYIFLFLHTVECTEDEEQPDERFFFGSELQLAHVLFRHGDRTPSTIELQLVYPKNPYINESYYPIGLEALTNNGKMRLYKIGQFIRSFYPDLLNADYIPNEISVRSTEYDRAKMSAQLFLAGLYPPTQKQLWNSMLKWQPIPYTALPLENDDMLIYFSCPRYIQTLDEVLETPYFQKQREVYKDALSKLSDYTGFNMSAFTFVHYLSNTLQAQANWGLPAPSWAKQMMPQITEMTSLAFASQHYTEEQRKLEGGQMLYKMIEDFKAKIDGKLNPPNRKMFVYSGHENNVASILANTGVFEPHQPTYGATVILELRKLFPSQKYIVRVLYMRDLNRPVQVMRIPNCGQLCDINKFIQLTANNVVSDYKPLCPLKSS